MPTNSALLYTEVNTVHIYTWWLGKNIRRVNNIWGNQQPFVSLYLTKNTFSWYLCYYIAGHLQPYDTSASTLLPAEGGEKAERSQTLCKSPPQLQKRCLTQKTYIKEGPYHASWVCAYLEIEVKKSFVKLKIKAKWVLNVNFKYSYGKKRRCLLLLGFFLDLRHKCEYIPITTSLLCFVFWYIL